MITGTGTCFQLDLLGSVFFCTVHSSSQRYTPLGMQVVGAEKPLSFKYPFQISRQIIKQTVLINFLYQQIVWRSEGVNCR